MEFGMDVKRLMEGQREPESRRVCDQASIVEAAANVKLSVDNNGDTLMDEFRAGAVPLLDGADGKFTVPGSGGKGRRVRGKRRARRRVPTLERRFWEWKGMSAGNSGERGRR